MAATRRLQAKVALVSSASAARLGERVSQRAAGPGHLYVLVTPYVAAAATINADILTIGGFRYSGWLWVVMLAAGLLLLAKVSHRVVFPLGIWLPWVGYLVLSLAWIDAPDIRNLQSAAQIAMPVLVGAVASAVMREPWQLRALAQAFQRALPIVWAMFVVSEVLRPGGIVGMPRVMAMTGALISCVFLARQRGAPVLSMIGWAACLALAVASGSRMAAGTILFALAANPMGGLRSRALSVGLVLGLALAVLLTPSLRTDVLRSEAATATEVLKGKIDATGRFEAWPLIWAEAQESILIGLGAGESARVVSQVWGGSHIQMTMPHNDYLRILLELGVIGMILFLWAVVRQLIELRRRLEQPGAELRATFASAYLGLCVLLLLGLTDNPISYNVWFTNPLFVLLGSAYGVAFRQERADLTAKLLRAVRRRGAGAGVPRPLAS